MSRTLTAFNGGDHRNFDVVKIQIKTALTAGGYRGENSRARRTRLQGIFCGRARRARLFRGRPPSQEAMARQADPGYRRKDRPHRGRLQGNGCMIILWAGTVGPPLLGSATPATGERPRPTDAATGEKAALTAGGYRKKPSINHSLFRTIRKPISALATPMFILPPNDQLAATKAFFSGVF